MRGTRVLVCGGRDYSDGDSVFKVLDSIRKEVPHDALTIIQGGAPGADALVRQWCVKRGVPFENYAADWQKFGRSAGPIRNQRMLDEGKPDMVVHFPGGSGTSDMVRRAKNIGVKILDATTL